MSTTVNNEIKSDNFENEMFHIYYADDTTSEYSCSEDISYETKCRFVKIIENRYIEAIRPDNPKIRAEIKLRLENNKPFSCSPRRLASSEKEKLQELLDEYLKNGIICPSDSEYASPIVLVKKNWKQMHRF